MSCLLTVRAVSLVLGESPTFAVFQPGPRGNQLDTKVIYSQLSIRRTLLGPALSVRLTESQIKGVKKGRDQL